MICILIAEDCAITRRMTVDLLKSHGYLLLQACDGLEALNISHAFDGVIDLLITDIHMPNINGHDLVRMIKKERPQIRILIISSDGVEDFPMQAVYTESLVKPASAKQLVGKVKLLLAA